MAAKQSAAPMNEPLRRALADKRRANVEARKPQRPDPEPALKEPSIRTFPDPIIVAGTDPSVLFPVYIPDPKPQNRAGHPHDRGIVDRIQGAAGIVAVMASDHLRVVYEGKKKRQELVDDQIAKQASLAPDTLFRLGKKEFAKLQLEGPDFDRVVALSFAGPGHGLTNDPVKLAEVHLKALGLLTVALLKTQYILAASNEARKIADDGRAGEAVVQAYHRSNIGISLCDLVRIAALADINPAPIWIQHAQFMAPVLEIARFGGKLVKASRRGGQVRLDRVLFPSLRLVLGQSGEWPDGADAKAAFLLICQLIGACVDVPSLLRQLDWHDDFELDLVIGEPLA